MDADYLWNYFTMAQFAAVMLGLSIAAAVSLYSGIKILRGTGTDRTLGQMGVSLLAVALFSFIL